MSKSKVFQVNLGGGEPAMTKDYLEVIKYISSKGMKPNLSTSGWFFDENEIDRLVDNNIGNLYISIDHHIAENHNSFRNIDECFEKAINVAKLSAKKGIKAYFSTVITKLNFDCIEDIASLAEECGIEGVNFKRFKSEGNGEVNKDQFVLDELQESQLYEKIQNIKNTSNVNISLVYGETPIEKVDDGCPCGKVSLGLTPDGEILPCVYNSMSLGILTYSFLSKYFNIDKLYLIMSIPLIIIGFVVYSKRIEFNKEVNSKIVS